MANFHFSTSKNVPNPSSSSSFFQPSPPPAPLAQQVPSHLTPSPFPFLHASDSPPVFPPSPFSPSPRPVGDSQPTHPHTDVRNINTPPLSPPEQHLLFTTSVLPSNHRILKSVRPLICGCLLSPLWYSDSDSDVDSATAVPPPVRCGRCRAFRISWPSSSSVAVSAGYCSSSGVSSCWICSMCGFRNEEERSESASASGSFVEGGGGGGSFIGPGGGGALNESMMGSSSPRRASCVREWNLSEVAAVRDFDSDFEVQRRVPLTFVFVVECSAGAVRRGVAEALRRFAKEETESDPESSTSAVRLDPMVSLISFADAVQVYRLKGETTTADSEFVVRKPSVFVMGEVIDETWEPYLPCIPQEIVVPMQSFLDNLDLFLHTLEEVSSEQRDGSAMGSAIRLAGTIVESTGGGGKILVFSTNYPTVGFGASLRRESFDKKIVERFVTPKDATWTSLATELGKKRASVDLFLFPAAFSTFVESSSLLPLSRLTFGHLAVYHQYRQQHDGSRLFSDIRRSLCRFIGYDVELRVRCSIGFSVRRFVGICSRFASGNALRIPCLDSQTCIGVEFEIDDFEDAVFGTVQCAILFTSPSGDRLLRVFTQQLHVATEPVTVFQNICQAAEFRIWTMECADAVLGKKKTLASVRDESVSRCVSIFQKCLSLCSGIPESLNSYLLFSLGLIKSPAFRALGGLPLDQRVRALAAMCVMSTRQFVSYISPRVYSLGEVSRNPFSVEPPSLERIRVPSERAMIRPNDVYLLSDGLECMLLVGPECPLSLLQALFGPGVQDYASWNPVACPVAIDCLSVLGSRLRGVFDSISKDCYQDGSITLLKATNAHRVFFLDRLVKDENVREPSYSSFLLSFSRKLEQ